MGAQKQKDIKKLQICSLLKTIEMKLGPIKGGKSYHKHFTAYALHQLFFFVFEELFWIWWFRSRKLIHRSRTWTALFLKLSCPISLLHSSSPVHVHYHYFHLYCFLLLEMKFMLSQHALCSKIIMWWAVNVGDFSVVQTFVKPPCNFTILFIWI